MRNCLTAAMIILFAGIAFATATTSDANSGWQSFDANVHLTCTGDCAATYYRIAYPATIWGSYASRAAKISSITNAIVTTVNIGAHPWGMAAGTDGTVWVTEADGSSLLKINPATNSVTASLNAGTNPIGVAIDRDGNVWVTSSDATREVKKFNPTTNLLISNVNTGHNSYGIAADSDGNIWVTNYWDNSITKISSVTNSVIATINDANSPAGIAVDASGFVWVANYGDGNVLKINPATNSIVAKIPTGNQPYGIAVDNNGFVWVTNSGDGNVSKINAATGEVTAKVTVGATPIGIAVEDKDYVWVSGYGDYNFVKINASTNAISAIIPVTGQPSSFGDFTGFALKKFVLQNPYPSYTAYDNNILISADGNHRLEFFSIDSSGNAESTDTNFVLVDKNPPSVTAITGATDKNHFAMRINWNGSSDAGTGVKQYWLWNVTQDINYPATAITTKMITGLDASTQYCFKVKAEDNADHNSAYSAQACFYTLYSPTMNGITPSDSAPAPEETITITPITPRDQDSTDLYFYCTIGSADANAENSICAEDNNNWSRGRTASGAFTSASSKFYYSIGTSTSTSRTPGGSHSSSSSYTTYSTSTFTHFYNNAPLMKCSWTPTDADLGANDIYCRLYDGEGYSGQSNANVTVTIPATSSDSPSGSEWCGNRYCGQGEDCNSCARDCGECGATEDKPLTIAEKEIFSLKKDYSSFSSEGQAIAGSAEGIDLLTKRFAAGHEFTITRSLRVFSMFDSNGQSRGFLNRMKVSVKNISGREINDIEVLESIPKEFAQSATQIASGLEFTIIEDDPLIGFSISSLANGETAELAYDFNKTGQNLLETEKAFYAANPPVVLLKAEENYGCLGKICDDLDACTVDSCMEGECVFLPKCSPEENCSKGECIQKQETPAKIPKPEKKALAAAADFPAVPAAIAALLAVLLIAGWLIIRKGKKPRRQKAA